jgi:hypothetical protein
VFRAIQDRASALPSFPRLKLPCPVSTFLDSVSCDELGNRGTEQLRARRLYDRMVLYENIKLGKRKERK